MARSVRYKALQARLTELRRHLLPQVIDPTAAYSTRQIDRVFAYRLLAHAELEHCLEQLVTAAVAGAWAGYKVDRKPRTCLMALVAYYEGELGGPPKTLQPPPAPKGRLIHLDDRINKAREHHVNFVIRQNHGMAERNVLRLLMPVGLGVQELDPAWLSEADAFSAARGTTAHQTGRIQQVPDPGTELVIVRRVADGMRAIDARLTALLND